jgi:hypothetical protein
VCRFPNLLPLPASCVGLELRPLPSIGITRLPRYYGPLRHPIPPGLSLAGVRLVLRLTTAWGFPCYVCLPLPHMPSPIPRRNPRLRFARLRLEPRPSPYCRRVGFRIILFEACSVFIRITACMVAKSLTGPSTPEASAASLPPRLLQLLPAGAKVAGRDSHPLKDNAFARRTTKLN